MTGVDGTGVHVLTVCTGNICRSPAVHLLLEDAFGRNSGITVSSAGVMALVGAPVSVPMASLLRDAGVNPDGFAASHLTEADVRRATVVLGLTRAHRSQAVSLWPAAVRRSYTLKELARLAPLVPEAEIAALVGSGGPAARLAALATLAGRYRMPVPAGEEDIIDPYRRSDDVYASVFAEIREQVDAIVRASA